MSKNNTRVLVIDDEKEYRDVYRRILKKNGYEAVTESSGKNVLKILDKYDIHLVILDLVLPNINGIDLLKKIKKKYDNRIEVIMVTGYGSIESAVEAMKSGAFGFFVKSHNPDSLLHEIEKAEKMLSLHRKNEVLSEQLQDKDFLLESNNEKMNEIIDMANKVAASEANVLITGESGVGKEILAKYIHYNSNRKENPFIAVNCSAYSENLLESELFGHRKGAFTGANQNKEGRFKKAEKGTLFLDEIGEIPLSIQVKLLRVIENKKVKPVGSDELIPIDFRLISATNKDIQELITNKEFRKDLFYRVNTIEINIPPLRERKEDLKMFINFFIKQFEQKTDFKFKKFETDVLDLLLNYNYPGNIRELKNIIERLIVLSSDGVIKKKNLPDEIKNQYSDLSCFEEKSFKAAKKEFEAEYIEKFLQKYDYNVSKTARKLDISRRHLINKIKEYKLKD